MVPGEKNPDQLVWLGRNQAKPDPFMSALLAGKHAYTIHTHSLTLSLLRG